ncbi:MAG: radical SAM protein [Planctomycetota bacterium]
MSTRSGQPSSDERFIIRAFEPCYLELARTGELGAKVEAARSALEACECCPRCCKVNRLHDETGVCRTGRHAVVASAFPHHGEEDCLRGWRGSGTIFFANCNLHCVFCQNWDISQMASGRECSAREIASLMLDLQSAGCHNINWVTPEHVVPQAIEALALAVTGGLRIPVVYNTSAYDGANSLALLDGLIDIYMPDFKHWEAATGQRLSGAEDYPARARAAIKEMQRQVGPLKFGADGVARRGLLVRHLVMPGFIHESVAISRWLAAEVSCDTYINIMDQYRPAHLVGRPGPDGRPVYREIDRRPTAAELAAARAAAREAGLWRFDSRG